ncbi:MAG: hypothetical protein ACRCYC_10415 [Paraclostridium sp.]|uniref:hypothetical protein n=1 Tax=Paraclostridium sp. TaxID=2023273 RepID=UPI003F3CFF99
MEVRKKKRIIVVATVIIGFIIISSIFFSNLYRINKNKKNLIAINTKSNIEMSLKTKDITLKNLYHINKIYDDKKECKIVIEDALIDGELLFLGISLSQNFSSSNFKVTSKEEYLPHIKNFENNLKNFEISSQFEKDLNDSIIKIFNSEKIENKDISLNTYIPIIETLYNWGLSKDDFLKKEFKISDSTNTSIMNNIAIPNINVKLNNSNLPLLTVDSPAIINKSVLEKIGFDTTKIPENFNTTEYTLVYKLDNKVLNEPKLTLDITIDNLSISPYYPVTVNPNFKSTITLNNNKNYIKNILNKNFSLKETDQKKQSNELKILNFVKANSFNYVTLEYSDFKNSFYLPVSFRDSKNKPLDYLFNYAIPIQHTNYIICMFPKNIDELNLLILDENNKAIDSLFIK